MVTAPNRKVVCLAVISKQNIKVMLRDHSVADAPKLALEIRTSHFLFAICGREDRRPRGAFLGDGRRRLEASDRSHDPATMVGRHTRKYCGAPCDNCHQVPPSPRLRIAAT